MKRIGNLVTSGDRQLLEMQLELECVHVEAGNTLVPFPCPHPDAPPRLLVARHDGDYSFYYRHDLPGAMRDRLAMLPPEQAFDDANLVHRILGLDASSGETNRFRVYVFPDTMTSALYPDVVRLPEPNEIGAPVFGCLIDAHLVSGCSSSRENDESAEAWVWTEPDYRGRGYAGRATMAWAHDLQQRGKTPFYSHAWDNLASQAVARKLGLRQFLAAVGYS